MKQIVTWPYFLRRGHSEDPSKGACAMDAINWLVHGVHGDHPACASPAISSFVMKGDDSMPDDTRQRLLAFLPRIAGSRSEAHEEARVAIMVIAAQRWAVVAATEVAATEVAATEVAAVVAAAAKRAAWAEAAEWAAKWAARAAAAHSPTEETVVWNDYYAVLDAVLNAGPRASRGAPMHWTPRCTGTRQPAASGSAASWCDDARAVRANHRACGAAAAGARPGPGNPDSASEPRGIGQGL